MQIDEKISYTAVGIAIGVLIGIVAGVHLQMLAGNGVIRSKEAPASLIPTQMDIQQVLVEAEYLDKADGVIGAKSRAAWDMYINDQYAEGIR